MPDAYSDGRMKGQMGIALCFSAMARVGWGKVGRSRRKGDEEVNDDHDP